MRWAKIGAGNKLPPETVAEIKRLHAEGASRTSISRRLDVSRGSVCRYTGDYDYSTAARKAKRRMSKNHDNKRRHIMVLPEGRVTIEVPQKLSAASSELIAKWAALMVTLGNQQSAAPTAV